MKHFILSVVIVCFVLPITAFAAELQYTALYVGSNKAFVNDVETQIDEQNSDVAVFVENERSYVRLGLSVKIMAEMLNGYRKLKQSILLFRIG